MTRVGVPKVVFLLLYRDSDRKETNTFGIKRLVFFIIINVLKKNINLLQNLFYALSVFLTNMFFFCFFFYFKILTKHSICKNQI